MGNKYTKRYTEEFKRDAIALVDSSGKTVTAGRPGTRQQLGVLARLVPPGQSRPGRGRPGRAGQRRARGTRRLCKENREQQQTIEILKKPTAFSVKESDR